MTGTSTLDPDNFPTGGDRKITTGHTTGELGPSDSSDSGSDISGSSGLAQQDILDLGSGTTSDLELSTAGGTAGPDVGDANLDSDGGGTGERAEAGRDSVARDGADIDVDHIETMAVPLDDEDIDFLSTQPPGSDAGTPDQAPRGK